LRNSRISGIFSFGNEGADRSEEGIELGGPACREVDAEHARVIIAEDEALSGFVAHTQKLAQVPPQLFDTGFGAYKGCPTAAPSGIDEITGEAIFALQLHEVRGSPLKQMRKVPGVEAILRQ
jgi:hypothetical protein